MSKASVRVTTFYRFAPVPDCHALRERLYQACASCGVMGTILIAPEGVNATITGTPEAVASIVACLEQEPGFASLDCKHSVHDEAPFLRLKVRVRSEIITFGQPDADPSVRTGEHVDAQRWNELIDDPDVTVLDTRNDYEHGVGTFAGAEVLPIRRFTELPDAVRKQLDPQKQPRVAMFCTGGVRCEKAAAHLLNEGFEAVYQLDGGILRYLEQVREGENRWQGECFVFDERVTVDAELQPGSHALCRGCRFPLSAVDRESPLYEPGVSCPHCHARLSDPQKAGFRERYRQEALARRRNRRHVGARPGGQAAGGCRP